MNLRTVRPLVSLLLTGCLLSTQTPASPSLFGEGPRRVTISLDFTEQAFASRSATSLQGRAHAVLSRILSHGDIYQWGMQGPRVRRPVAWGVRLFGAPVIEAFLHGGPDAVRRFEKKHLAVFFPGMSTTVPHDSLSLLSQRRFRIISSILMGPLEWAWQLPNGWNFAYPVVMLGGIVTSTILHHLYHWPGVASVLRTPLAIHPPSQEEFSVRPEGWFGFKIQFSEEFIQNFTIDKRYAEVRPKIVDMLPRIQEELYKPQSLYENYALKGKSWGKGLYRLRPSNRRLYFTVSEEDRTVTILAFRFKSEIIKGAGNRTDPQFKAFVHDQKNHVERDPEIVQSVAVRLFGAAVAPRPVENPLLQSLLVPSDIAPRREDSSKLLDHWRISFYEHLKGSASIDDVARFLFHNQQNPMTKTVQDLHQRLVHRLEIARSNIHQLRLDLSRGMALGREDRDRLGRILIAWYSEWSQRLGWLKAVIDREFEGDSMPNVAPLAYIFYTLGAQDVRDHIRDAYESWVRRKVYISDWAKTDVSSRVLLIAETYRVLQQAVPGSGVRPLVSELVEHVLGLKGSNLHVEPVPTERPPLEGASPPLESDADRESLEGGRTEDGPEDVPAEGKNVVPMPSEPRGWLRRAQDVLAQKAIPELDHEGFVALHALLLNLEKDSMSTRQRKLAEILGRAGIQRNGKALASILAELNDAFVGAVDLSLALGFEIAASYYPLDLQDQAMKQQALKIAGTTAMKINLQAARTLKLLGFKKGDRVLEIGGGGRPQIFTAIYSGADGAYLQKREGSPSEYQEAATSEVQVWETIVNNAEHLQMLPTGVEMARNELKWAHLRILPFGPLYESNLPPRIQEYDRIRMLTDIGSLTGYVMDATDPSHQSEFYRQNGSQKFSHILATDVVAVPSLKVIDAINTFEGIERLMELIMTVADPAGALLLFSIANREFAVDPPEEQPMLAHLRDVLARAGWSIIQEWRVATPVSFGHNRGFLFRIENKRLATAG